MNPEPGLREKILMLQSPAEIEGFLAQLQRDARLTPESANLLAMRAQQLAKGAP